MKKIISLVTFVTLLNSFAFAEFNDIDSSHWGYEAVQKMSKIEILSGYPDGSFKPGRNITLAEYASIFSKFFDINENVEDNYFVDIESGHWAKGKIEGIREYIQPQFNSIAETLKDNSIAIEQGIKAELPITREIVIYSLNSILALDNSIYSEEEAKILFADFDKILYPEAAFMLYKNNIISGEIVDGKVYIHPDRYITRAEISSMFAKLLMEEQKISNNETIEVFEEITKQVVKLMKDQNLNEVKKFVYDSDNKLEQIDFNSLVTKDVKSILNKYFGKLEFKIVEYGFDSYNKAHIVINKSAYDYTSVLAPLKKLKVSELTTEKMENVVNDIVKQYKKLKTKTVNTVETIEFIKTSDGWKIVL